MIGFFAFLIFLLPALLFLGDERTAAVAAAPAFFIAGVFALVFYVVITALSEAFGGAQKNKPVAVDIKPERPPSKLVLILQRWFPDFDDVALCRIPEAILNWALLSGIIILFILPSLLTGIGFVGLYGPISIAAVVLCVGGIVFMYERNEFIVRKKKHDR